MPVQPSANLLELPQPTKLVINGAVEEEHTDDDDSDKDQPNGPQLETSSLGGDSLIEPQDHLKK